MKVNNKRSMCYSVLHCENCNMLMVIPRPKSAKRKENHVKTMYCACCKTTTNFIEKEQKMTV